MHGQLLLECSDLK